MIQACLFAILWLTAHSVAVTFASEYYRQREEQICWTTGFWGYYLEGNSENPSQWNSLELAQVDCMRDPTCGGVTQSVVDNYILYITRSGTTLHPSPPGTYGQASWLKMACDPSYRQASTQYPETASPTLDATSTVTADFFKPQFECAKSKASQAKRNAQNITRIWVWGERNSGTGMTQRLMNLNFNLSEEVIGGLPWKHGYASQQALNEMTNTLNIFVVKDAYAWLNSMKQHPHHAPYFNHVDWSTFLTMQWYSEVDGREVDRNPYTRRGLDNIMQLRAAKLRDWLAVRDCLPYTYTVRYEDLIRNSTQVILDIAKRFQPYGLQLKNSSPKSNVCLVYFGECIDKYSDNAAAEIKKKIKFYLNRDYISDIPDYVKPYIRRNLDNATEQSMGYVYPSNESPFNYWSTTQ